jgi:hypothetical protein
MFLVKPCVTPFRDCCGVMMYLFLGVTQFLCTLSTTPRYCTISSDSHARSKPRLNTRHQTQSTRDLRSDSLIQLLTSRYRSTPSSRSHTCTLHGLPLRARSDFPHFFTFLLHKRIHRNCQGTRASDSRLCVARTRHAERHRRRVRSTHNDRPLVVVVHTAPRPHCRSRHRDSTRRWSCHGRHCIDRRVGRCRRGRCCRCCEGFCHVSQLYSSGHVPRVTV